MVRTRGQKNDEMEEVARFVAPPSWLAQLERECLRWGVPRSKVIVDAVTRVALGPKGLRNMYGPKLRTHRGVEEDGGGDDVS
jgi:hypothetical protein